MTGIVRPTDGAEARVLDKPNVTNIAWVPPETMELADWIAYGRRLGALGRGVAWWIGDWLRFGNMRYGERYPRAARVTGYDTQSLMNMAYVAARFDPERRRENLSWSHHAELAALDPAAQDHWLDVAEQKRLSVHCLRLELRAMRRAIKEQQGSSERTFEVVETQPQPEGLLVCPVCDHVIDIDSSRLRDAAPGTS